MTRRFTVTSTADDGAPTVHSCATAEEEASTVNELRALGHTGIETTETRQYRFLGVRWLDLAWTRVRDEVDANELHVAERLDIGHEVFARVRPNDLTFHSGQVVPHARGGLSVPYVPRDDVPSLRLLWQRAPRAARWRELVAWPLLTLAVWFAGLYVLVVLVALLATVVF
jgi:hypothetical protein